LSNPVIFRNKCGEIFLCFDFRYLNREIIKENYPLPNLEMLQQVTISSLMSILDGFSGYNQVLVVEEDKPKTNFVTPWETYAYIHMPFGLKNGGETLQREMYHALKYLIGKFMDDYQDDLTIHSNIREEHIKHLRE
jgi:hypothetical protein